MTTPPLTADDEAVRDALRQALLDGPTGSPEPRWWDRAKCRDDARFYPGDAKMSAALRRDLLKVCARCPVAMSCLLDEEEGPRSDNAGFRACMTATERERIRRERRKNQRTAQSPALAA